MLNRQKMDWVRHFPTDLEPNGINSILVLDRSENDEYPPCF